MALSLGADELSYDRRLGDDHACMIAGPPGGFRLDIATRGISGDNSSLRVKSRWLAGVVSLPGVSS